MRPYVIAALLAPLAALSAFEIQPRVGGQFALSRTGFEPGGFAELSLGDDRNFLIRPEVFFNEDGDLGWGGSVLWQVPLRQLPRDQSLYIGPRFIDHNADDWGFGVDALGLYDFPIGDSRKHYLEGLVTAGFVNEQKGGDDSNEPNVGVGIAYAYQFGR